MGEPIGELVGKRALVTGGSRGIGAAIALALADKGADVAISYERSAGRAAEVVRAVEAKGRRAVAIQADSADPAAMAALVGRTVEALGGLDILVNNAGIQHVEAVENFPADAWEKIIAINLSSAFYATKAAIPIMKAQGRGRIINVASAHGLVASPFKSAYVAAKHGVIGFTKTVALELAQENITCNAICPGFVETPIVAKQIQDQARTRNMSEEDVMKNVILGSQPTKRFVTTDELAGIFLYLASDLGASANGAHFSVDGGWTAQ